jgi:hypothetical protein
VGKSSCHSKAKAQEVKSNSQRKGCSEGCAKENREEEIELRGGGGGEQNQPTSQKHDEGEVAAEQLTSELEGEVAAEQLTSELAGLRKRKTVSLLFVA